MLLADAVVPAGFEPTSTSVVERRGAAYRAAQWSSKALEEVAGSLIFPDLEALPDDRLLDVWATP